MNVTVTERTGVRKIAARALLTWGGFAFLACATVPQDGSFPAQKALIGKTTSEVLACAGEPSRKYVSEDETILAYQRGAPVFEESYTISKTSVPCPRHACEAVVVLKGDRVTEVRYHPTPHAIGGCEHCEEIFQKCLP